MCNLDARHQRQKADLQSIVKDNCKHLSANCQRSYCSFFILYELPFDGTLDGWSKSRSPFNERYEQHPMAKLSQCQRYTRNLGTLTKKVERLCRLGVLKRQQVSN
jgi:hypothetical protein